MGLWFLEDANVAGHVYPVILGELVKVRTRWDGTTFVALFARWYGFFGSVLT